MGGLKYITLEELFSKIKERNYAEKIEFIRGKSILALTTICFDIFVLETLLSLAGGLRVVIATEEQQKDTRALREVIHKNNIDMLQMTPSRLQLLMSDGEGLSCLENIKEINDRR